LTGIRLWGVRRWGAAVTGTVVVALAIGLPTEMIPSPWFIRMMPVVWWNHPVWVATAVLAGLLLATYVREGQHLLDDSAAGGTPPACGSLTPAARTATRSRTAPPAKTARACRACCAGGFAPCWG
jgi:hypothetical protein